jgi:MoxR-like ATPase
MTSNSENCLPDAFLSRCVYYDIPFPDEFRLRAIVKNRVPGGSSSASRIIENAIKEFVRIRQLDLKKLPTIAELFGWVRVLFDLEIDVGNLKPGQVESLRMSCAVLAKTKEDLELMRREVPATGDYS